MTDAAAPRRELNDYDRALGAWWRQRYAPTARGHVDLLLTSMAAESFEAWVAKVQAEMMARTLLRPYLEVVAEKAAAGWRAWREGLGR